MLALAVQEVSVAQVSYPGHEQDLERLAKIARGGMAHAAEAEDDGFQPDDLRLDSFVIVAVYAWTDRDGEEREGCTVWSEARRHYAKSGMLSLGLDRIAEEYGG